MDTFTATAQAISRLNAEGSKVGVHVEADARGYRIVRTETGKPVYERIPTLVRVRTLIHQIPPRKLR